MPLFTVACTSFDVSRGSLISLFNYFHCHRERISAQSCRLQIVCKSSRQPPVMGSLLALEVSLQLSCLELPTCKTDIHYILRSSQKNSIPLLGASSQGSSLLASSQVYDLLMLLESKC